MRTSQVRALVFVVMIAVCAGTVVAQVRANRSTRRTPAAPQRTAPRTTQQQAAPARRPAAGATQRPLQQQPAKQPAAASPKVAPTQPGVTPKATATPQPPAQQAAISPEELYTPPKSNNVAELSAFLARLIEYQPQNDEQLAEYQKRAPAAMNNAANRILQLEKDKSSAAYRFAMNYVIAMQLMEFEKTTPQDRQKIYNYLSSSLANATLDPDVLDLAVAFAESLEFSGETKLAAQTYAAFASKMSKNTDPLVLELANSLNASSRRLNLIGQPMQILGKTIDGQPFRWADYRGKVVVVDFWATWCAPCVAEFPRLQKHYQTYGKAGLEIVGISLDQDAAQLQAYLQKNPLPWVTLHEGNETINPTAKYYGVSALPTTIVVDRQGRVVALNARGEELDALLAELFAQAQRAPAGTTR